MRCHKYEVWQKSNETDFLFIKICIYFFKHHCYPLIVPLDSYSPMETLFPRSVAALEVFNQYGLQHIRYTLLDVF
jgi:hypothetical protein